MSEQSAVTALMDQTPQLEGFSVVRALEDGIVNESWLIEKDQQQAVLRINATAPAGVDRDREALALSLVSEAGLAPEVYWLNADRTLLITEYLDCPSWDAGNACDPDALGRLGRWLSSLHSLEAASVPTVDALGALENYLKTLREVDPDLADSLKPQRESLVSALADAGFFERNLRLCHLDLHVQNIFEPHVIMAIDWEFAGRCQPELDLAMFIHYQNLTPDEYAPLIEGYYGAWLPEYRERVSPAIRLAQWLELAWLGVQRGQGKLSEQDESQWRKLRLVLS